MPWPSSEGTPKASVNMLVARSFTIGLSVMHMDEDKQQSDDVAFMGFALELARQARESGEVPIGAVVVRDGQVVGKGYNCPIRSSDPTAHAEINAIRSAAQAGNNYRLGTCTLYVTLEPCVMCAGAIVQARIKRLVFGATDPKGGAAGSLFHVPNDERLNHQVEIMSGILQEECGDLLRRFFRERRGPAARD
jgi:tRNA(adenine34) deaminase